MKIYIGIAMILIFLGLSASAQNISYAYDRVGRLTQINEDKTTTIFHYDPNGNRTGITDVLPLTLLNFQAQKAKQQVLLIWETANEINTDKFDIEFSLDATHFQRFAMITAKGSSQNRSEYSTIHCCPIVGTNYYRLKMIDRDGKFAYSPVRTVVFDADNKFKIYPNPVTSTSNLTVAFEKTLNSDAEIYVYSSIGAKIIAATFSQGQSIYNLQLPSITSGTYFIVINTKEKLYQSKFIRE